MGVMAVPDCFVCSRRREISPDGEIAETAYALGERQKRGRGSRWLVGIALLLRLAGGNGLQKYDSTRLFAWLNIV